MAIREVGAKLIVVMGHSNCGAIKAAVQQLKEGSIGFITSKINKAIAKSGHTHEDIDTSDTKLMERIA